VEGATASPHRFRRSPGRGLHSFGPLRDGRTRNARRHLRSDPTSWQGPIPRQSWKRRSKCWSGTGTGRIPSGMGRPGGPS